MDTDLRVLGPVQFTRPDGTRVKFTRPNQRRLLAMLAMDVGRPVPAHRLGEVLALSPSGLRTSVRRLRSLLGHDVIVTEQPGYALRSVEVDARVFVERVARAQLLFGGERARALESARLLWHGPAYREFADERWTVAAAVRLEELHAGLVDDLAEYALEQGSTSLAIAEMERQVAEHPLRDRSWGMLMRALAAEGRRVEALRAYQSYRDFLVRETGIEPSAQVRELERRITSDDLEPVAMGR